MQPDRCCASNLILIGKRAISDTSACVRRPPSGVVPSERQQENEGSSGYEPRKSTEQKNHDQRLSASQRDDIGDIGHENQGSCSEQREIGEGPRPHQSSEMQLKSRPEETQEDR